jgi:lysozyme family protein
MKNNFEKCFVLLLKSEGGFVNNPRDPGGMTNLGVTKVTFDRWTNGDADEQQMRALTPADVEPLYREWYWDGVRGDDLPAGVDYFVFDFAVNSGIGTAIRMLQDAADTVPDGKLGPVSMTAVLKQKPRDLIQMLQTTRINYLRKMSTWSTFGKGWTNRVNDVTAAALEMA